MTPSLRSITVRQLTDALAHDGWTWDRTAGSHRIYAKAERTVSVPYHRSGATLPPKTLARIITVAGWTQDDLRRLKLLK